MAQSEIRSFEFFEIRGKETVRSNRYSNKHYTPNNTKRYEAQIRHAYLEFHKDKPMIMGAVRLQVIVLRKRPKRHFKKIKGRLSRYLSKAGEASKYPLKKPDLTNIEKSIEDALNGIAYKDDCQIVRKDSSSDWNDRDRKDSIEVSILPLEACDRG